MAPETLDVQNPFHPLARLVLLVESVKLPELRTELPSARLLGGVELSW